MYVVSSDQMFKKLQYSLLYGPYVRECFSILCTRLFFLLQCIACTFKILTTFSHKIFLHRQQAKSQKGSMMRASTKSVSEVRDWYCTSAK